MKILTLQEVDPMGMGVGRRTTDRPWEARQRAAAANEMALYDFEHKLHELDDPFTSSAPKARSDHNFPRGQSLPLSEYRVGDKVRCKVPAIAGKMGKVVDTIEASKYKTLEVVLDGEEFRRGFCDPRSLERAQRRAFEVGDRVRHKEFDYYGKVLAVSEDGAATVLFDELGDEKRLYTKHYHSRLENLTTLG